MYYPACFVSHQNTKMDSKAEQSTFNSEAKGRVKKNVKVWSLTKQAGGGSQKNQTLILIFFLIVNLGFCISIPLFVKYCF